MAGLDLSQTCIACTTCIITSGPEHLLRAENAHAASRSLGAPRFPQPCRDVDVRRSLMSPVPWSVSWKSAQEPRRSCRTIVTAALPLRISLTLDQGDATVVAFVVASVRRTM